MLHIVQGFLSKKKPVRYKTKNMAWLWSRAGFRGLGIRSTGISHWRQYIVRLFYTSIRMNTSVMLLTSSCFVVQWILRITLRKPDEQLWLIPLLKISTSFTIFNEPCLWMILHSTLIKNSKLRKSFKFQVLK